MLSEIREVTQKLHLGLKINSKTMNNKIKAPKDAKNF